MENRQRLRIGDLLVNQNYLTNAQRIRIARIQARCGRPFGELAESLYGVSPTIIERVWTQQYLTYNTLIHLDAHTVEAPLLPLLTRRQAWQFQLLPLSRADGVLTMVTTRRRLPRAAAFSWRHLNEPVYLALAPQLQLQRHLHQNYPWSVGETFNVARAVNQMRPAKDREHVDAPDAQPVVVTKSPIRPVSSARASA